jgi:tryptophanyl-tRNA synthetase
VEEQRKNGGNPDVCMVYRYFYYMFEPDDEKLKKIYEECRNGERLCGQCKAELTEKINSFLEKHQQNREEAREKVEDFMLRD